jgi:hypothetical protein
LVAILAITLVAHTAVALNTSVNAGGDRLHESARFVLVNRNSGKLSRSRTRPPLTEHDKRARLTQPEQRTLLIRSRAPSRPIWERSLYAYRA